MIQRFFKTGPGEYGEGDVFVGVYVPDVRRVAREFADAALDDVLALLRSAIHEERLLALLMLVRAFQRGDAARRRQIYRTYTSYMTYVNNWDLVDCSAEHIVGGYLSERSRAPLRRLAASPNLWRRRIAVMATFHFIRRGEFGETLDLARRLLADREDLIHKAVGWMLREIGKRDVAVLDGFLRDHCRAMPRTMLRYAIERLPAARRRAYLAGAP